MVMNLTSNPSKKIPDLEKNSSQVYPFATLEIEVPIKSAPKNDRLRRVIESSLLHRIVTIFVTILLCIGIISSAIEIHVRKYELLVVKNYYKELQNTCQFRTGRECLEDLCHRDSQSAALSLCTNSHATDIILTRYAVALLCINIISIVILALFLLEYAIAFYVFGPRDIIGSGYLLDTIITVVALVLELIYFVDYENNITNIPYHYSGLILLFRMRKYVKIPEN